MPTTHRPLGVVFAFSAILAWMSAMDLTPASSLRSTVRIFLAPVPVMWQWESMSPGITVLPPRSMTSVASPTKLLISSFVPTAKIFSNLTATASAMDSPSSTVTIFPFSSTKSANIFLISKLEPLI